MKYRLKLNNCYVRGLYFDRNCHKDINWFNYGTNPITIFDSSIVAFYFMTKIRDIYYKSYIKIKIKED